MSIQTKFTAIADKIRAIRGTTGTMGLDAMATNLGTVQTNINSAFTAVSNKGGTVPSSKVSGNLASAINSIPEGAKIQTKSGTFRTGNNGASSVNCGFVPDVVKISTGNGNHGTAHFVDSSEYWVVIPDYNDYLLLSGGLQRTSNGFALNYFQGMSWDFQYTALSNKSISYTAVKYT